MVAEGKFRNNPQIAFLNLKLCFYKLGRTLKNIYWGALVSKVSLLQPATLLTMNFLPDISQRFGLGFKQPFRKFRSSPQIPFLNLPYTLYGCFWQFSGILFLRTITNPKWLVNIFFVLLANVGIVFVDLRESCKNDSDLKYVHFDS